MANNLAKMKMKKKWQERKFSRENLARTDQTRAGSEHRSALVWKPEKTKLAASTAAQPNRKNIGQT